MKRFIVLLLMLVTVNCFAQLKDQNALKQIKEMKIDKDQLSSIVEMMRKGGHISDEEASKSQKKLKEMSQEDVENLKTKAIGVLQSPSPKK